MADEGQRRSIKNVTLTKGYHLLYMGPQAFITLMILGLIYAVLLYRILSLAREGHDIPYLALATGSTLIITLAALLSCGAAVFAAHRMAGVHIKLAQVFDLIAEGHFDTRLKFRKTDQLEDVEAAFNKMMDSLQPRMKPGGVEKSTEENP